MRIRTETPDDVLAISRTITEAFLSAPHADGNEAAIVHDLRAAGALSLSLVAIDDDGALVGHVAGSPVRIGEDEGWTGLGPLAVAVEARRRGTGSALVRAALETLKARGAKGVVLVGDPGFYGRFGFAPYPALSVPGIPSAYVLASPFGGTEPRGVVAYHPAFSVDEPD
jgi:putative acetyltransferase